METTSHDIEIAPGKSAARQGAGAIVAERHVVQAVDQTRIASVDAVGAALAHELNQPLTAITLYIQTLQRQIEHLGLDAASEIIATSAKASREAERAVDIVRRMRRLSLRHEPDRQSVDLRHLARETIEMALVEFNSVIPVETIFDEHVPLLMIDPVQIRQIIANLLRNAAEATLSIADPRVVISISVLDDAVVLTVSDNGKGVDARRAARLFRAFETDKSHGQGLGLAISRMIAQSHGGDLVYSPRSEGNGSVFSLRLPIRS